MDRSELHSRYQGIDTQEYNRARENSPQWIAETQIMDRLLLQFPLRRILDIPVGTGRFFPNYSRNGNTVLGLDISPDMIAHSKAYAKELGLKPELLEVADILSLDPERHLAEVSVCVRFLNWVDTEVAFECLRSLARVTTEAIIFGMRTVDIFAIDPEQRDLADRQLRNSRRKPVEGKPINYLHRHDEFLQFMNKINLKIRSEDVALTTKSGAKLTFYVAEL